MEDYFVRNCESVVKKDIGKWEGNQAFFGKIVEHYQYELEIQTLINQRNKEKIALLKD